MNAEIKSKNFVGKLEYLLQNPSYQRIIAWSDERTVIEVLDCGKMEKEILPYYFRHQKFESFVRQLNLYGFKKLKAPERQRFTHPRLQAGASLTEITSCKHAKAPSQANPRASLSVEKSLSQTSPSPRTTHQKLMGSAFSIYNPLSENRRNTFTPPNNVQRAEAAIWSGQAGEANFLVFPHHQYLVWNWMESYNSSYVGNILLSDRRQQQHREIAEL